ncbi:methyltransferase family protein [Neolewinella xylanilytica]|uniref:Methyltransferase family protein n=1 Tax=Neolewinella xylanilytica TaxID=1514080 RepID=A0A2S6I6Z3_9BACT|nr:class I SAM-dependent methyltransferase [Neolewinella xylanilytica]PPK87255.1 methyltransferase family protein [Neolewinella xylanilytica]
MDKSNGYERIASDFIAYRATGANATGSSAVYSWARGLPPGGSVLDLGCGPGIPITGVLIHTGLEVFGIDASPSLVAEFRANFPAVPVACEAVEDSPFFDRSFDAVLAWGLLFLLPKRAQTIVIRRVGEALRPGGRFLFTAPYQEVQWEDAMTGRLSLSLGAETYRSLLADAGLTLTGEFEDEGENHYYSCTKD